MPSTCLILVAHAATVATRRAAFATGEEPLDDAGAAAARASARAWPPGRGLVAPAEAARQSAEELGLAAEPCPALRDLDVGRWRGRRLADLPPGDAAAWFADPSYAGHGGESFAALFARMGDFLQATARSRGTVVAITHAAPLRAALVSALGAPPATFWRVDAAPLTAAVFGSDGTRWSIRGLGPLAELP